MKIREFIRLKNSVDGLERVWNKIMESDWFHNRPDLFEEPKKEFDPEYMMYVGIDISGTEIWLRPAVRK